MVHQRLIRRHRLTVSANKKLSMQQHAVSLTSIPGFLISQRNAWMACLNMHLLAREGGTSDGAVSCVGVGWLGALKRSATKPLGFLVCSVVIREHLNHFNLHLQSWYLQSVNYVEDYYPGTVEAQRQKENRQSLFNYQGPFISIGKLERHMGQRKPSKWVIQQITCPDALSSLAVTLMLFKAV